MGLHGWHPPVLVFRRLPFKGIFYPLLAFSAQSGLVRSRPSLHLPESKNPFRPALPQPENLRGSDGVGRARGSGERGPTPLCRPAGQRRQRSARRAQRSQAGLRPLSAPVRRPASETASLTEEQKGRSPPLPARTPPQHRPARSHPCYLGWLLPQAPRPRKTRLRASTRLLDQRAWGGPCGHGWLPVGGGKGGSDS